MIPFFVIKPKIDSMKLKHSLGSLKIMMIIKPFFQAVSKPPYTDVKVIFE